jgi:general secretion pathway protein D
MKNKPITFLFISTILTLFKIIELYSMDMPGMPKAPASNAMDSAPGMEAPSPDKMSKTEKMDSDPEMNMPGMESPEQPSMPMPGMESPPGGMPGMPMSGTEKTAPPSDKMPGMGSPPSNMTGMEEATDAPGMPMPGGEEEETQPTVVTQTQPSTSVVRVGIPSEEITPVPAEVAMGPAVELPTAPEIPPKEPEKEESEEKKDIYLNFENTDLLSFINYMSELKKINLIPDKALEGAKISLTIRDPLTLAGAWKVFLTVLEMAGFSIIKVGEVYKIIPKDQKLLQPLPAYINIPYQTLPDSDETIRYVVFLQNIQVGEIKGLLEGMLSATHSVVDYAEVNGLIITDKCYNIKAAMKVINELDQTGLQESVVVMRLKQANAVDVKTLLESLIRKDEGSPLARLLGRQAETSLEYFSPSTRIIAEERSNSLILMGNQKSIQKIEDFITKHLDSELKGTESPLHIYELQHTDASQIKDILETVTDVSTVQTAGKYGAVRGGVKYFKGMKFQVDKDGNRLIVQTTDKQDWKLLKKTIADLDKPQPQVAIETLLVTVDMTDNKELGGRIRNKENQIGGGVNFQSAGLGKETITTSDPVSLLGNLIESFASAKGVTAITLGKGTNIWAIFRALKEQTNTSIMSQPFLTVANKTKASINVGETRRVVSETSSDATAYTSVTASTKIELTPQINLDGVIRFDMNVIIKDFLANNIDTEEKNLTTNVTVANGQVLVLGGFVKTKVTESQNKTPVLGDIPVLGWLFKQKKRSISKTYIFVFMSPTIIKPRTDPGVNLYTRMKLHDARDKIEESVETKRINDPIHNWFFNPKGEDYSHKVTDFANARYQPTTVDIRNDPYYRVHTEEYKPKEIEAEVLIPEDGFEEESTETLAEDQELIKRREKLKEMLSIQPIIKEKKDVTVDTSKRKQFKDFIANKPTQHEAKENQAELTSTQKEQFKKLLSSQPMVNNKQPEIQSTPKRSLPKEQFKKLLTPLSTVASNKKLNEPTLPQKPLNQRTKVKQGIDFDQLNNMKSRQANKRRKRGLA